MIKNKRKGSRKQAYLATFTGMILFFFCANLPASAKTVSINNQTPVLIAQTDEYESSGYEDDSYGQSNEDQSYENQSDYGSEAAEPTETRRVLGVSLLSVVARGIGGYLVLACFLCFLVSFSALCAALVWNLTKLFNGGKRPKVG